ncbi:hypothetical protein ACFS6H_19825 [Terrimonas rubra]|uniref:Uncharacterized protein n=1 Tax=Terrimonas rubra TaxID=1035890 RepID=A0ABW6A9A7_9BACT
MKKSIVSIGKSALIGAATMLGGATQATVPVNQTPAAQQISIQAKQDNKRTVTERKQSIVPNGLGGIDILPINYGRSPKEYGQLLQQTGRQKWNKKTKK